MSAPLCHFEFMTDAPDKCKAFYADVFGWEYDDSAMEGYSLVKTEGPPSGGVMQRPPEAPVAALNVYFQVDDIDATLAKAKAAGGTIILPKTPIPNVGSYAMFIDTEGLCVGIFQE